jgi:hypothetical protein
VFGGDSESRSQEVGTMEFFDYPKLVGNLNATFSCPVSFNGTVSMDSDCVPKSSDGELMTSRCDGEIREGNDDFEVI